MLGVVAVGVVPETGAIPGIGAGVGDAEEEAGVAPDTEGVEDMANIDTFLLLLGGIKFRKSCYLVFCME